jgi:hypothetical protein
MRADGADRHRAVGGRGQFAEIAGQSHEAMFERGRERGNWRRQGKVRREGEIDDCEGVSSQ